MALLCSKVLAVVLSSTLLGSALVGAEATAASAAVADVSRLASATTVTPGEDTTSLLRNPAMGWVLYLDTVGGRSDIGDYMPNTAQEVSDYWDAQDAAAAKASIFYLRISWSDLEPVEGQYSWAQNQNYIDLIQGARDRGLKIAFRVVYNTQNGFQQSTPDFVRKAGAVGHYINNSGAGYPWENGHGAFAWSPYENDPVFRVKYENFLTAFAAQYDDPDVVDYIDAAPLGWWGESHWWNPGGEWAPIDPTQVSETYEWITDLYASKFTHVILMDNYNDGFIPLSERDKVYETKGYAARRDSFGSPYYPTAEKDALAALFPGNVIFGENYYHHFNPGWWQGDGWADEKSMMQAALDDATYLHSNIMDMRIPGDSADWMNLAPDLVDDFVQNGGYRFVPESITYPSVVTPGTSVSIASAWKNVGDGRIPNDLKNWNYKYKVAFALLDTSTGEPVYTLLASDAEPSEWIKGTDYSSSADFDFANAPSGDYDLGVAIVDATKDYAPGIQLATTADTTASGWSKLGSIAVDGSNAGTPGYVEQVARDASLVDEWNLGGSFPDALPNSATLDGLQNGDYSISAWFKADSVPAGTGSANDQSYAIVVKPGYHLGLRYENTGQITLSHFLADGSAVNATSPQSYGAGEWIHVAGTVDKTNGSVDLYVDGRLEATNTFTAGTAAYGGYGTAPWNIGIAAPSATTYGWAMDGAVDEVRLYDSALSAASVKSIYNQENDIVATPTSLLDPEPGVVAKFHLNDDIGTSVTDTSGNGYDATVSGSTLWDEGKSGSGLHFEGSNSSATLPANTALNTLQDGDYTISAWFKADTVPAGTGTANNQSYAIVIKQGSHLGLRYENTGQITLSHFLSTGAAVNATSPDAYPAGKWIHVAGVVNRSAGTAKLYVDGALKATQTFTANAAPLSYGAAPWRIGIAAPGASTYRWAMDGTVDEVRLADVALSDAEVSALYQGYVVSSQASTGYSLGVQGTNQWYYAKYDTTLNRLIYLFRDTTTGYWHSQDVAQPWILVAPDWQHPDQNVDSVREWRAPMAGTASITGNVRKMTTGGNGVVVSIRKNGSTIWGPYTIGGTDTTGFTPSFTTEVHSGDAIDIVVGNNGDTSYDGTTWDPSVTLN